MEINRINQATPIYTGKIAPKSTKPQELPKEHNDTFASGILNASMSSLPSTSGGKVQWIKQQRPAELIKTHRDGKVEARNVRWGFKEIPGQEEPDPIFKDTTIDPSKIKDAYLVIEPFAPEWIAAHGLMCFEFEDGGVTASDGSKENRMVLSIEARLKEGDKYSLIDGMKNKFTNVYQLGTWNDSIHKRSIMQGHKMVRYPLALTKKQKQQLLKNSLRKSFEDHSKDYYHTIKNNCFNNQIRLLNTVLPPEKRIGEWRIPGVVRKFNATLPKLAYAALASKGLLGGDPVITLPNKNLYPDKQIKKTGIGNFFRKLTNSWAWHVIPLMTGALSGAALGSMILPPGLGTVIGGVVGGFAGSRTGTSVKRSLHFKTEPSEKYLNS